MIKEVNTPLPMQKENKEKTWRHQRDLTKELVQPLSTFGEKVAKKLAYTVIQPLLTAFRDEWSPKIMQLQQQL